MDSVDLPTTVTLFWDSHFLKSVTSKPLNLSLLIEMAKLPLVAQFIPSISLFQTERLINLSDIKGDVLDIGCGYGPIGIYVAKRYNAKVTMSDINQRAISLAKKNTYLNKVDCEVIQSDMYENIIGSYDHIITNPPIRIGKEKLFYLLKEAKQYLKPYGNLLLVVNKNQGAKSLVKELEKDYLVQIIDKNKGFYIILARNC